MKNEVIIEPIFGDSELEVVLIVHAISENRMSLKANPWCGVNIEIDCVCVFACFERSVIKHYPKQGSPFVVKTVAFGGHSA